MSDLRIGTGYDAHAFAEGVPLVLGGVALEHPRGLAGHSDGDVLAHALIDALLGAANLGALTASGAGDRTVHGAASAPLGMLTATAAGDQSVRGQASAPLGGLTATAAGDRIVRAVASLIGVRQTAGFHCCKTRPSLAVTEETR